MYKVRVNGLELFAEYGRKLSDVLTENRLIVEHPCGGRGLCRKCTVRVNGREVLSCAYVITEDITVELPEAGEVFSIERLSDKEENGSLFLCLDVGTTTLEMALVDATSNQILRIIKATNPQGSVGADVISRIDFCRKNGVTYLNKLLVDKINELIKELGVCVEKMYVAGNTTMLHTFLGEDCSSLGVAPYTPMFLEGKTADAESVGIENVGEVECLPGIHSFVGADIVAGLNVADMPSPGKYNLLIDLGTNAELALWNADGGICTSAAAGPCFEGANISCGMSAVSGAISSFREGRLEVIGNTQPKGLCATGLIDVISALLRSGAIDKTGFMAEDFSLAYGVTLTQEDVREYQVAKSAVLSAVKTLVREKGITFEDIQKVYISGGFSHGLNIKNAIETGLFPAELENKCSVSGNTSLLGTVRCALGRENINDFVTSFRYIDLSQDEYFSMEFIKNMEFCVDGNRQF